MSEQKRADIPLTVSLAEHGDGLFVQIAFGQHAHVMAHNDAIKMALNLLEKATACKLYMEQPKIKHEA